MPFELNSGQAKALEMVKKNKFCVLSGSAGTGKTTVTKMILEWAQKKKLNFICCCPSGKAAKRMTEATGYPAATIHKTLNGYVQNGEFVFEKNENDKLTVDFVIIDESSMVGNSLLSSLFKAISPKTKVLLIGDPRQLPAVQAGKPFLDIIESRCVPHTSLTETFRFSGDIIKACTAIRDGQHYIPSDILDLESGKNLRHVECDNPQQILNIISTLTKERMPERGYDPFWDVQIISPVNEKGLLSCKSINTRLQNELNPLKSGQKQDDKIFFRPGDKIINIKNREVKTLNGPGYIVNGDMGEVVRIFNNKMHIKFHDPERETELPKADKNILGAYAITCHRMQGSEIPVAIIPVHSSFGRSLNRAWIYTAISRGKEIVLTIGQQSAINAAIDNNNSIKRNTKLQELIIDQFGQDI